MQRKHESKIQAYKMMLLRRVEGVTRLDRVRNEDVRRSLGQEAVVNMVKKQRRWKVRMEKMKGDRLVKRVFEEVTGGRPRGRLQKYWNDNFKVPLTRKIFISVNEAVL